MPVFKHSDIQFLNICLKAPRETVLNCNFIFNFTFTNYMSTVHLLQSRLTLKGKTFQPSDSYNFLVLASCSSGAGFSVCCHQFCPTINEHFQAPDTVTRFDFLITPYYQFLPLFQIDLAILSPF